MFDPIPAKSWKHLPRDAHAYGRAFAKTFGPSGKLAIATSAEIGNEPGLYDDARYRLLFEHMARGLREGDPKLKILPANMTVEPSGRYTKNVECVRGLEDLYDALRTQTYAQVEGWPTWRRTYPEDRDPNNHFLTNVRDLLAWRDAHAPGKPVWVTEFGWDASTKPAPPPEKGATKQWIGSTDEEQARYLVRSFMLFAGMGVERAYIFFFNDDDVPSLHAAAGLTRNYQPKPAYWAVAHLYATLGDYRFDRVLREGPDDVYAYAFRHGHDPAKRIVAVWLASGAGREAEHSIDIGGGGQVVKAQRMPLAAGKAEDVKWEARDGGAIKVKATESPLFLWISGER
jgi:serine/threonine-protein kinase ATR